MATSFPFHDEQPGPEIREKLNELYALWEGAIGNIIKGDKGWSPLIRAVTSGAKVALELYDWAGGEGPKPAQVGYLGAAGYVADIADAIDFRGPVGLTGPANTLTIGTVTTGAAGADAVATVTGTPPNQTLNLTLPRGAAGPANTLTIGTVATGAPGAAASAEITGAAPNQTLNLSLPKGDTGNTGPVNSLTIGTVATNAEGAPATASLTGTAPNQTLNLGLPRGATGNTGLTPAITVGTVTTGAPGTSVVVTVTGTTAEPVFNFTIPAGQNGTGAGDVSGPDGADDMQLAQFDGPTGKIIRAIDLTGILAVDGGRPYVATPGTDYATPAQVSVKQDELVSGTNIRTVNGNPLPGSGDVNVQWKAVDIPSSANLDTYQTEGVFVAPTTLIAASLSNAPTAVAFSLRVWKTAGVVQEVTEFQANNTRKTYQRSFALGAWSAWARFYTTIDVPSKTAIGLGNVDNTADVDKPISNAQQTALAGKQETLVSGTNVKTVGGQSILGSGDVSVAQQGLLPQNAQSAAYTLTLDDMGKHVLHPAADTTARTFTIPANAAVAFPIGAAITFVNQNGTGGVVTIAITADVMRLAGAGTTGSRTLARNGVATALKIAATEWIISGSGLS